MALYKIKIQVERQATGLSGKEAVLAVLKDLEIDTKFGTNLPMGIKAEAVSGVSENE